MKLLLILATLFLLAGCGTTTDGRKTFLGISKLEKEKCIDQWAYRKKGIMYRKCF